MHNHHHEDMDVSEGDKAICPVMKEVTSKQQAINDGLTRAVDGVDYYMCCKPCLSIFDKDMPKYI